MELFMLAFSLASCGPSSDIRGLDYSMLTAALFVSCHHHSVAISDSQHIEIAYLHFFGYSNMTSICCPSSFEAFFTFIHTLQKVQNKCINLRTFTYPYT